jgi:hypothetical protein
MDDFVLFSPLLLLISIAGIFFTFHGEFVIIFLFSLLLLLAFLEILLLSALFMDLIFPAEGTFFNFLVDE